LPGTQKFFHYVFVPSTGKPSSDPVVLWLNGGPGCSSLDGFFYEHGPYKFGPGLENITLVPNPYAWTQYASILYLESPVGVGYTYSNNDLDYFCNDASTAADNLAFLVAWFKKAPKYASLPFFVFGESYAGVYVPTLAAAIVKSNQQGSNPKINLVGTGSGNPVTNTQSESTLNAWVPFTYGHGLMSPNMHANIQSACTDPNSFSCSNAVNYANNGYNNINPYWVYGPCFYGSSSKMTTKHLEHFFPRDDPINRLAFFSAPQVPCIDSDNAENWLNRPQAAAALHVPASIQWSICSNTMTYSSSGASMLPNYHTLLQNNIRVLVYSGDADSVVPWTGTSKWVTQEMNLGTPNSDWVAWMYNDGDNGPQVGGWKTTYSAGLTYATVRGSGHMVAQFNPARSAHMFSRFIQNRSL
jgi:serine carboxypeptidase-like clade 1